MIDSNPNESYNQSILMQQALSQAVSLGFTLGQMNLDSGISQAFENVPLMEGDSTMARIRLPIPLEYGGGYATGATLTEATQNLLCRIGRKPEQQQTPLFKAFAWEWYNTYKQPHIAPKTQEQYEYALNAHLVPTFGDMRLADIHAKDVQQFFNAHMQLSQSTQHTLKTILNMIFKRAVADDVLEKNVMATGDFMLSKRKSERQALTKEQLIQIIEHLSKLNEYDKLYQAILCFTPLRSGEILALQWKDIDFERQIISVNKGVVYAKCEQSHYNDNQPIIGDAKKGSVGEQTLLPLLAEILAPYKGADEAFVIGGNLTPVTKSAQAKRKYRIKRTIDMFGATPHVFRHTYLTMANDLGADVKTLQAMARHKDPSVTMRVYVHPNAQKVTDANMKVNLFLEQAIAAQKSEALHTPLHTGECPASVTA